jgi:hypothetical protein
VKKRLGQRTPGVCQALAWRSPAAELLLSSERKSAQNPLGYSWVPCGFRRSQPQLGGTIGIYRPDHGHGRRQRARPHPGAHS